MENPENYKSAPQEAPKAKSRQKLSSAVLGKLDKRPALKDNVYRKTRITIKRDVLPILKKFRPNLKNEKQFWESQLVHQEIVPILLAGNQAKKPYYLFETSRGFRLQSIPENIRQKPLMPYDFDLNYYDTKLSLKGEKPFQKPNQDQKESIKTHKKEFDEDSKRFNRAKKVYDLQVQKYGHTTPEIYSDGQDFKKGKISLEDFQDKTFEKLDKIAQSNYEVSQLNADIQSELDYLAEAKSKGKFKEYDFLRIKALGEKLHAYEKTASARNDVETLAAINAYQEGAEMFVNTLAPSN